MSGPGPVLVNSFLRDEQRRSHSVQLYGEDASLVEALGGFIAGALSAGDAAVVVATPEHRFELSRVLASLGVDVTIAGREGRYVAVDAAETLALVTLEGWPDPVRFAHHIGDLLNRARAAVEKPNSPVSVFGEMVALLWANGKFEAAVQLEKLWSELSRTNDFQAHDELERRVAERTAKLREKNEQISRQAERLDRTIGGLRELSVRLLRVQDDERRRIARDLHDGTGQSLALLSMNLSTLEDQARRSGSTMAKGMAEGLAENAAIVKQISTDLRTLSYLLHPPLLDEMGLDCALRWFIDGFAQRSNIKVSLALPDDLGRLSQDLEIAIFRVVQECLTNVHRHSGSATASIRLYESPGNVVLEVHDEGTGIAPERLAQISSSGVAGVGVRGMRERIKDFGGELEVSSDSKGTTVRVVVPHTTAPSSVEMSEAAEG